MIQTDIDRIKAYIEKATPGPWFVGTMNDALFVINEPPRPAPTDTINTALKTRVIAKPGEPHSEGWTKDEYEGNTQFIASARSDLPLLVQQVEWLRQQVASYEVYEVKSHNEANDAAKDWCKILGIERDDWGYWKDFTPHIDQLRKERDELLKDKERLDWLEKNGDLQHLYEEGRPDTTAPVLRVDAFWFDFDSRTLRDCIDAALHPTSKEQP